MRLKSKRRCANRPLQFLMIVITGSLFWLVGPLRHFFSFLLPFHRAQPQPKQRPGPASSQPSSSVVQRIHRRVESHFSAKLKFFISPGPFVSVSPKSPPNFPMVQAVARAGSPQILHHTLNLTGTNSVQA